MEHLSDFQTGDRGIVCDVHGEDALLARLLDMGFTPGTRVSVALCAPTGDPIVVRLRGYLLSLRRSEAACISVQRQKKA